MIYTSDKILSADDLYALQDTFCSSGVPFTYIMTRDEIGWLDFVRGRYSIADWIDANINQRALVFNDCYDLSKALYDDGSMPFASCLSHDTALAKLFFWLCNEFEEFEEEDAA